MKIEVKSQRKRGDEQNWHSIDVVKLVIHVWRRSERKKKIFFFVDFFYDYFSPMRFYRLFVFYFIFFCEELRNGKIINFWPRSLLIIIYVIFSGQKVQGIDDGKGGEERTCETPWGVSWKLKNFQHKKKKTKENWAHKKKSSIFFHFSGPEFSTLSHLVVCCVLFVAFLSTLFHFCISFFLLIRILSKKLYRKVFHFHKQLHSSQQQQLLSNTNQKDIYENKIEKEKKNKSWKIEWVILKKKKFIRGKYIQHWYWWIRFSSVNFSGFILAM